MVAPQPSVSSSERYRRIVRQSLPIMGGMSTYVFLELIDMLFVGYLGTVPLAAVGVSVFVAFTYLSVFGGVNIAVQATSSRLEGEGSTETATYLNIALLVISILAPASSGVLVYFAPQILQWMNDDPQVVALGVPYLRWLLATGFLFAVNAAFMGYWNATNRSGMYLRVVLVEAAINVPLNYAFMFGWWQIPAFGVEGAGIGTFLAAVVGAAYHMMLGFKHCNTQGFLRTRPTWYATKVFVRLLLPSSAQQLLDNLALTLMFRIVGWIGTLEVAAYSVLANLIGAVGIPAWGLGVAGAALVGQALGRKDPIDAHRWAWDVAKVGTIAMAVLGIPLWLFPESILGIFIHEAETIAIAVTPCRILGVMIAVNGLGYMFAAMLNGAGDVKRILYVNLGMQYLILLPLAYLVGVHWAQGLLGVWLVHQLAFRALGSGVFIAIWQQRRWAAIHLW